MIAGAVGLRAKTGRAIAVVLSGSRQEARFVWRGEVSLVDPADAATGEPYHQVMELPWNEAMVAVQPLVAAIEKVARAAVRNLIAEMKRHGVTIRAAGIVGSTQRSLDRIGNYHIRAHAAEGILFRRVLEVAGASNRLECFGISEAELESAVSRPADATLKEFGRVAGAPWRSDERLAASVAWMALD